MSPKSVEEVTLDDGEFGTPITPPLTTWAVPEGMALVLAPTPFREVLLERLELGGAVGGVEATWDADIEGVTVTKLGALTADMLIAKALGTKSVRRFER